MLKAPSQWGTPDNSQYTTGARDVPFGRKQAQLQSFGTPDVKKYVSDVLKS